VKQKIKTIALISLQILLVAGLLVCLGFAADKQSKMVCGKVTIHIDNTEGDMFINNEDVIRIMDDQTGSPIGKTANQISLPRIEAAIESNPHVKNAEVWMGLNGDLSIQVKQKRAVIRIINRNGDSFYLDENGFIMPLSSIYTASVPVATGEITETAELFEYRSMDIPKDDKIAPITVLDDLFHLAQYMEEDTFWSAQVQQLVVDEKGEISMVPTMGNHIIQFGKAEDVEEKFEKLMYFYLEGLNKTGWNKYAILNLKFKDQVVCVKKNQTLPTPTPVTASPNPPAH
jgi:cell division protein FtsQ